MQEAIALLITFRQFQILAGEGKLRQILPLVFAREPGESCSHPPARLLCMDPLGV